MEGGVGSEKIKSKAKLFTTILLTMNTNEGRKDSCL